MPLGGLFGGGGSSSGGKPQMLQETTVKPKKDSKMLTESNCKGVSLKLEKTRVTIEKQLAEGGFAIVYLVTDRKNKKYALKRQFVKDNQTQLNSIAREHKLVSELWGHKNILAFVDRLIAPNKYGQYDCMLLTAYHKKNVLQLMNDRISNNLYLAPNEIINIFCDMCEAVARLHHSKTPVIHRDLKVENILISDTEPPTYILCDFGSATTMVMSLETNSPEEISTEIERNTTLCYRAPEMIDFYGGQPIGTKSDIWSLGVMLYRLCYFTLPFEESALAIQSGNYNFPAYPNIPPEIRAIIYMLLDVDVSRRPNIFECSKLAFEAWRKPMPNLQNIENLPAISLDECIKMMEDKVPRNQREVSPRTATATKTMKSSDPQPQPPVELVSTIPETTVFAEPTTTSVNPRLRPKAVNVIPAVLPSISPVPPVIKQIEVPKPTQEYRQSFSGETTQNTTENNSSSGPLSCPLLKPSDLGFTDLENTAIPRNRAATDFSKPTISQEPQFEMPIQQHRRNVSDTSQIFSKSAFKPYSQTAPTKAASQVRSVEDMSKRKESGEWNPFLAAPYSNSPLFNEGMDDRHFGKAFDELPRRANDDYASDSSSSIDSRDPFGAAPFDQLTVSTSSSAAAQLHQCSNQRSTEKEDDEEQLLSDSGPDDKVDDGKDEEDGKKNLQTEEDSEIDEQRMRARRRYSYENIDGVGDDASSDSRGRTDRDDSEEEEEDDETDSRKGGDTSHDEDSQNTVGSEDGEGGNRPLLEDDGLEDDDDHELLSSFSSISTRFQAPLFIGTTSTQPPSTNTNPFLRDELTPKPVSPAPITARKSSENSKKHSFDDDWDLGDRWTDRRDTVFERPNIDEKGYEYAPATLPRQVTPMAALNKLKPDLPANAPVSIIPSMSTTSFPDAINNSDDRPCEPAVGTLIQVAVSTPDTVIPPTSIQKTTAPAPLITIAPRNIDFVEGPKTPKNSKHRKEKKKDVMTIEKNSDDLETDGSEAEMFAEGNNTLGKKKKKSTFSLRSSHPSIIANDLQFAQPLPPIVKKHSKEKKSSSSHMKRASTGALNNASFVNTSFQLEDIDATHNI